MMCGATETTSRHASFLKGGHLLPDVKHAADVVWHNPLRVCVQFASECGCSVWLKTYPHGTMWRELSHSQRRNETDYYLEKAELLFL